MAGHDISASGFNPRESTLGVDTVGRLETGWVFDTAVAGRTVGPIHSTPVLADGVIYVGDMFGTFFAVGTDGKLRWATTTKEPNPTLKLLFKLGGTDLTASPIFSAAVLPPGSPYVIFADADSNVYCLDRRSGEEIWSVPKLNAHELGGIAGNSVMAVKEMIILGLASVENFALALKDAGLPLECCSERGGVVALDIKTGQERWRYDAIPEDAVKDLPAERAPFAKGPAGSDIWGQPSYDPTLNTIYVGTGQNFSPTAEGKGTDTEDAIIALDADHGTVKWIHQFTKDDIWVNGIPNPDPSTGRFVDMDIGDSPKLYEIDGRRVVGAGQKSGDYHVLDATTGELIATTSLTGIANALGGLQSGGAVGDELAFHHGLNPMGDGSDPNAFWGRVVATSLDGKKVRWKMDLPLSPTVGGLALANGVLYFQSPVEEPPPVIIDQDCNGKCQWALYAVNGETGKVIKRIVLQGRAISSPIVSRGRVYAGTGNLALASFGIENAGSIIEFKLAK